MFVGGSHLASTDDKGNIDIFDTITNTCKKIKFNGDKKFISDDFENGIVSIDKNKIILSGHRVGFFDLKTNKISKFDEFTCGRDFFPILRDSNTLYRIWPNSENFGCSRGQCMGSHNYLQVLSTDLKTGVTKIINNFQIESSGFISPIVPIEDYSDPYYIKVDDNTVLIYTVGTGNTKNMILYSYNISENKFKKLIKIDNIGKNYDVTAQVLSDGTILFTGGVARQEGCDYMKSSEYMPSAIYNLTQNKIIKRPKMLYKNIPASFHEVCLIPLKNKDILVMESGTIRQYFDINSKEFKPIANPINIGKSSNQKVTVINDNSILISHGYIYDDRDSDKLNTTAWIVNY